MTAEPMLMWGIGLFLLAALLLVIEVFVPSGGVFGALSTVASIAGVVAFWRVSTTWGLSSLLTLLVLAPLAVAFAFKVWPNTPIGRMLILNEPDEDDPERIERDDRERRESADRTALLDARGVAITDLRPGGTVRVDGRRYDALAEGGVIESGARVRVVGFDTGQIRVRRA
jgi:membrane-bound ClpP family serine protease